MATYKWSSPHEWLEHKISEHASTDDTGDLVSIARELASKLDADSIQDIFQSDMEADGYFTPEPNPLDEGEISE